MHPRTGGEELATSDHPRRVAPTVVVIHTGSAGGDRLSPALTRPIHIANTTY